MLLASGESQALEYKAQFPKQLTDLGKEIAAFATSNAGTILLGVGDDGTAIGLEGCSERSAREAVRSRVEGICANAVKPPITPHLRFAIIHDAVIAAIDVPKGFSPVYYSANIPYLRQLTAARPMAPDEVVEAVLTWQKQRKIADEPSAQAAFLSSLATTLVDVIVRASELTDREFGAWLDETRFYLGSYAGLVRDLAAQAPPECNDTLSPLGTLADQLDTAAHEQLTFGSGFEEMRAAAGVAVENCRAIAAQFLKPEFFTQETIDGIIATVATIARKQDDLTRRINRLLELYKMNELRSDAASNGLDLRRAAAFLTILGQGERGEALNAIGVRLREIETRQIYMDGGRSQQAIIDDLQGANADLQALIAA